MPMRPVTDIPSLSRGRAGARTAHKDLWHLPCSSKQVSLGIRLSLQTGVRWPARVDVSGMWTTSSFPDMLLHFRDAASCIYHWVESLTRLQMCKSGFLNCCVTFCSEQLGSEAVPGTTARLFRAWVSTRLVIRVSQIEGYLSAPLSNAESTEYLIQIFVLLVWQLREMLINNIYVKMCVSLLIIIHWPFLWTMSYIRYSPRVSSCGCDYYINPLGNLSWCSHEFSSHGQVDECFQSKSCKVKVASKSWHSKSRSKPDMRFQEIGVPILQENNYIVSMK